MNSIAENRHFKYLTLLASLYCVILCCGDLLGTRLLLIDKIQISAGSFTIAMSYVFSDIVTEVYGYSYGRQMIWLGVLGELVFSVISQGLNSFPTPTYWHSKAQYDVVFDTLIKNAVAYSIANFFGIFSNIFILSKLKIFAKGKYFWLRSVTSSIIGESIYVLTFYLIVMWKVLTIDKMIILMLSSIVCKLIFVLVTSLPTSLIVKYLKKIEKCDPYDIDIRFTPFKYTIETRAASY